MDFRALVEPYRRELHVYCYQLLGSTTDADDVMQEILLAAWRGMDSFRGEASPRTWLYRIATNRCLNAVRDRSRRPPIAPVAPFDPPEPSRRSELTWLQPYPDDPAATYAQRESVELAFIAGLAGLPPRQAAALVLRDVLGYSGAEAADILGTTETVVKGALQRARATLAAPPPRPRVRPTAEQEMLARRFADALVDGDLDALLNLLTDDAWLTMPPAPHEYHGRDAVAAFLRASAGWRGDRAARAVRTSANGRPAFGYYLTEPGSTVARPAGLVVLTPCGDRIRGITRFLDHRLFAVFGLPRSTSVSRSP